MAAGILDLRQARSIHDIQSLIKTATHQKLILGRGWNQLDFTEKRMPEKADLDLVCPDTPVVLIRVCGHVGVVNSMTLKALDLSEDSIRAMGDKIDFAKGLLYEDALALTDRIKTVPTNEEIKTCFRRADRLLLEKGVTTVLSDDFCVFPVPYTTIIQVMEELYRTDELHVKLIEQVNLPTREYLTEFLSEGYSKRNYGKWRLGPLKLLADGSLGGRTAALRDDYLDLPGHRGILNYDDDELGEIFDLANRANLDCHVHAIGDRAIGQVLSVMEKSLARTNRHQHRHAIIHAQLADHLQIAKMKTLGFSAIVQPIFLESDIAMVASRIGQRKMESYLFHTMHQQGLIVGFGTDAPVESVDPFANIYAAMTRRSRKDAHLNEFLPEEAFSFSEAMQCYGPNNHYLVYDENKSNDDYLVLDRDPRSLPAEQMCHVKVLRTVIDGIVVYESPSST
jgi:hypothetical protein